MTRLRSISGLFAIALVTATAAHAQATRTWVSGVGDDANPCSRTAPCKTFAGAISKTAPGGEIDALDPGGFGAVDITKSITIDGGGGQVASALVGGGSGIAINAGSADTVIIRNVTLLGTGLTGDGIQIGSAGTVHVQNVKISGFQGNGINVNASGPIRVFVDEVTAIGNGLSGISAAGPSGIAYVGINNSHFESNGNAGVLSLGGSKVITVETTADGNTNGFAADAASGVASVTLTRCDANSNTGAGFYATNNAAIRATYSSSELNGMAALSTSNGGNTVSFGNNTIVGAGVFTTTLATK